MTKGKVPTYEEFLAQHSAGLRSLGLDEQFACFVVHLLTLKADESISYEKEDDIVITKKNGEKIFIQVKNSADTPVRKMTTADTDFWKTLKLWVDGYNHYTAPDKNKYFENRQFLIATNMAVENGFYSKIEEFQKQLTDIKGLRDWLNGFSSVNKEVENAVNALKALTDDELRQFALKVGVESYTDLEEDMFKSSLVYCRNNPATAEVVDELVGALVGDKKAAILATGSFALTMEQFIKKYSSILQKLDIEPELNVTEYNPDHWTHPDEIKETNMLRQLWDIGELDKDNPSEKTYRYLYQRRYYRTNIERFRRMELMDDRKQAAIELAARNKWQQTWDRHETRARNLSEDKKNEEAVECFHNTMEKPFLKYDENFSGGCYLKLSDEKPPRLGWHIDWKKKYGA